MKTKIIAVAMCLACLSTPVYTTGLIEAKIAAVAGVAKGAALLGAGALAAKGAVLKGVGSLLAAKGAAIKDVLEAATKPVEVAVPTIVLQPPATASKPCEHSKPNVGIDLPTIITSKPNHTDPLLTAGVQTPMASAGVQLVSKPVLSLLGDRLNGLLTTIGQTIDNGLLNKPVVVKTVQSPIIYKIIRSPNYYPVPIY